MTEMALENTFKGLQQTEQTDAHKSVKFNDNN